MTALLTDTPRPGDEHTRLRPCCEHEHPLSPHCWACDGVTDPEQDDAPDEIEEDPHA